MLCIHYTCKKTGCTHDAMCSDLIWLFHPSSDDHREVFSILPTHLSNHLFSLWAKHVWIQVLIILHRMSKYILSESFIDQQYRTLDKKNIMSDHFWQLCPKVLVHQFHCQGEYIFFVVYYILTLVISPLSIHVYKHPSNVGFLDKKGLDSKSK